MKNFNNLEREDGQRFQISEAKKKLEVQNTARLVFRNLLKKLTAHLAKRQLKTGLPDNIRKTLTQALTFLLTSRWCSCILIAT